MQRLWQLPLHNFLFSPSFNLSMIKVFRKVTPYQWRLVAKISGGAAPENF
jgi:hypothetical protein